MKNKLETVGSKIGELSKEFCNLMKDIPPCCIERLNEISEIYGLQNQVAALSNSFVADALTQTIKQIAYAGRESNHETICKYLKQGIEDLASGMNAADVLGKYDNILYDLRNPRPKHIGRRADILIIDDLCGDDVDKEELKEIIKNAEQKVYDFCGCNLKT